MQRGTILASNKAWRDFALANGGDPLCVSEGINYFDVCDRAALSGCGDAAHVAQLIGISTDISEIQMSIDDFGTGYSSLSYLKKFHIDYLKIDQSFVLKMVAGPDDLALCQAIAVMGHKLGIKVIAEGVETQEQRDLLTGAAPKRMRRRGACGACTPRARHIPLPDQALGATHQNGTIIA